MIHLLSPSGIDALRQAVRRGALLAFDFDGTLAPIVAEPARARMSVATTHALSILCERATVAVISGRSAADLRSRLPAGVRHALGNQGIDGWAESDSDLERLRRLCLDWQARLKAALVADPAIGRGVVIENKGVTLAVHYRLARNRDDTAARLRGLLGTLRPAPRVMPGKFVYDLLAVDAMDKRTALERLMERVDASSVVFVGDDEPDEVIFRDAPPSWLTVRVERTLHSSARFYLQNQIEVTVLLHRLVREHEGARAAS